MDGCSLLVSYVGVNSILQQQSKIFLIVWGVMQDRQPNASVERQGQC